MAHHDQLVHSFYRDDSLYNFHRDKAIRIVDASFMMSACELSRESQEVSGRYASRPFANPSSEVWAGARGRENREKICPEQGNEKKLPNEDGLGEPTRLEQYQ